MEFEFDPVKSAANARKHGIDFIVAQALWDDAGLVILPSKYAEEPRSLAIGRIGGTHWTAIITERAEVLRLISVRRARQKERQIYEEHHDKES